MKRTLENISASKWYHYKTLVNFFKNSTTKEYSQKDKAGIDFGFVVFKRPWDNIQFIVHPKTKRLKYITEEALKEVGFKN